MVSDFFTPADLPDQESQHDLLAALATDPVGASLGRLGEVAGQLAGWQGQVPPLPITQPRVVIFAGDHGIAARGVSPLPPSASVAQADEILAGGGAVNRLARRSNASIRLVDVSLDHEAWGDERVSRSCGAIDVENAMTHEQLKRAIQIGADIADQEIEAGADLLLPGELGVGATTVAAALMGVLTRTEPVAIVGPGAGTSDERWKVKVSVIRDAMFRARGLAEDPLALLRTIGSPDAAAMVGFIARAVQRRTPLLIDGCPTAVAAHLVQKLQPGSQAWFMAAQLTPEPAHVLALKHLGLTPLLALDMSTGQGVGALTALPLVLTAGELAVDN